MAAMTGGDNMAKIIKKLLAKGADPDIRDTEQNRRAVELTYCKRRKRILKRYLRSRVGGDY